MEETFLRCSHLTENIFDSLNDKNLVKCRIVSKKWQAYIDNGKTCHVRKITTTIKNFHEVGDSWKRLFNKGTTQVIMDLSNSVRKLYFKGRKFKHYKGITPLHVAAATGKLLLLSKIYKNAIDDNPKDERGWTALHYSAHNGYENVCVYIIENKVSYCFTD